MVKVRFSILVSHQLSVNLESLNIFGFVKTGKLLYSDGNRYEGEFKDNKFHGQGIN